MSPDQHIVNRFRDRYNQPVSEASLIVEREVIGADVGANGYTTVTQAGALAEELRLRPGMRLLDVGAGRGWPGLYLASTTGCEVVLTDVPEPALRRAQSRAERRGVSGRATFILAGGAHLPFRPRVFDAVVHTDTL